MVGCNGVDDTGEVVAFLAKTGKKLDYFKNHLVFLINKISTRGIYDWLNMLGARPSRQWNGG